MYHTAHSQCIIKIKYCKIHLSVKNKESFLRAQNEFLEKIVGRELFVIFNLEETRSTSVR